MRNTLLNTVAVLALFTIQSCYSCEKPKHPAFDKNAYYAKALTKLNSKELRRVLNRLIRGHTFFPYTPCTWIIIGEADQDPNKPTNIITIYTQQSIPKKNRYRGTDKPNLWNREHLWPGSRGFYDREQHAYSDAHALFASDKSVNSDRGSFDFGYGKKTHHKCKSCKVARGVWEPPDNIKGDIARAMFYMDVRYEGNDKTGVGDLKLVDRRTFKYEEAVGKLCTLLEWHEQDPVSSKERQRMEVIYKWQGNRNPFIDHPKFVQTIFGNQCK